MICEDTDKFKICYDYVKGAKPLYDKLNSIVWFPYCSSIKKGMWEFPSINKYGIYKVPMNLIDPYYLKIYINRKLSMLNSNIFGTIYVSFCFFVERLNVGILLERGVMNENNNILPTFLSGFKSIFPQNESILFD